MTGIKYLKRFSDSNIIRQGSIDRIRTILATGQGNIDRIKAIF